MVKPQKGNTKVFGTLIIALLLLSLITVTTLSVMAKKSGGKGKGLSQLPSVATDFPDNDQSAIEVHVTSAKKDIIGDYHIVGEIKNLSNDTLQFVQVTGHLYDASGQPIGVTTCCYTTPSDIEPGHTSTFDSFAQKDQISGKPTGFKLSYDWQ